MINLSLWCIILIFSFYESIFSVHRSAFAANRKKDVLSWAPYICAYRKLLNLLKEKIDAIQPIRLSNDLDTITKTFLSL